MDDDDDQSTTRGGDEPDDGEPRDKEPTDDVWAPRGAHLRCDGDDLVLVGDEQAEDLSSTDLIALSYRVQDRTVTGLYGLLAEACVLGVLAFVGVAAGWFETGFAVQILALTLTPSFAAWLVIARWAFPARGGL